MVFLPVVVRELSVLARQKSTYWLRVLAALAGGLLVFWLLLVASAQLPLAGKGHGMFVTLSTLAFVYALFAGARGTADSLSAEKREGTLGLLFLTDLKGYDVVFGKLVSSSINTLYGLLAVVPVLSVVLFLGGVTPGQIAQTALVLVNTLFLSLCVGMFVSALSQHDRKAMFGTVFVMIFLAGGPFAAVWAWSTYINQFGLPQLLLLTSPLFAFLESQKSPLPRAEMFYGSVVCAHLFAWLFLALAAWILPRSFQVGGPSGKLKAWELFQQRWVFGSSAARIDFRRQWLNRNPFAWLAIRDRRKLGYVWFLLASFVVIWIWVYWMARFIVLETSVVLLIALHLVLKIWLAIETCQRWIEDRQHGALELLFTAPISLPGLARGQGQALLRQFVAPAAFLTGLTLLLWQVAAQGAWSIPRHQSIAAFLLAAGVVFLADLLALRWIAAWTALRARSLNRAMVASMAQLIGARTAVFLALAIPFVFWTVSVARAPFDLVGLILVWAGLALVLDAILGWTARNRFLRFASSVASEPGQSLRSLKQQRMLAEQSADPELDPGAPESSRKETWSISRIFLVLAPVALLLIFGGYQWLLHHRIQRELKEFTRAGYPVDFAQLRKWRVQTSSEDQIAARNQLMALFPSIVSLNLMPPDDFRVLNALLMRMHEPNPNDHLAIAGFLEKNQSVITALREENLLQRINPSTDWLEMVVSIESVHPYGALLNLSQLLRLEMIHHLRDQPARAAMALSDSFALAATMQPYHLGLNHFAASYPIQNLQYFLSIGELSVKDLDRLERDLATFEQGIDLETEFVSRFCMGLQAFDTYIWSSGPGFPEFQRILLSLAHKGRKLTGEHQRELLDFVKTASEARLLLSELPENRWAGIAQFQSALIQETDSFHPTRRAPRVKKMLFDGFAHSASMQSLASAARASLALARHRLRHQGRLPGDLQELVPEFLKTVPLDPFDGAPLRYRRLPDGYVIYSIGQDGQDNLGTGSATVQGLRPDTYGTDISFSVNRSGASFVPQSHRLSSP